MRPSTSAFQNTGCFKKLYPIWNCCISAVVSIFLEHPVQQWTSWCTYDVSVLWMQRGEMWDLFVCPWECSSICLICIAQSCLSVCPALSCLSVCPAVQSSELPRWVGKRSTRSCQQRQSHITLCHTRGNLWGQEPSESCVLALKLLSWGGTRERSLKVNLGGKFIWELQHKKLPYRLVK